MFSKELNTKLDEFHLLKHPFYQAWNEGKLSREIIKDYAEQYYHHVKAFPRYISATHSICEDIEQRKILLENLNDEEDKAKQALTTFNIKETGEGKARWIGGYGLRAIILSTILAAPKKPPTRALSTLPSKKE